MINSVDDWVFMQIFIYTTVAIDLHLHNSSHKVNQTVIYDQNA